MENNIAYKAFNADMTCRDFQYEVGKEYSMDDDKIKCCEVGFHSCLMPFDVFRFYDATTSRFAMVEYSGNVKLSYDRYNLCSSKIKILKELTLEQLIEHQIEYIMNCTDTSKCGDCSIIKDNGVADCNILLTTNGFLTSSGKNANIVITNYYNSILSIASKANIVTKGLATDIKSCGSLAIIASLGGCVKIASSGYFSKIFSYGEYAKIVSSGDNSIIDSQGYKATIMCMGNNNIVRAKLGSAITLVEYEDNSRIVKYTNQAIVDGDKIKENTWYKLKNGFFTEANMLK